MSLFFPGAILFDLDGTLVDSAPDLVGAMNRIRLQRGLPPTPYQQLRPHASAGARGLIGAAFGLTPKDDEYEALRVEFLDCYAADIATESRLFTGIGGLLASLSARYAVYVFSSIHANRGDAAVPIRSDTPKPAPLDSLTPKPSWVAGPTAAPMRHPVRAPGARTLASLA